MNARIVLALLLVGATALGALVIAASGREESADSTYPTGFAGSVLPDGVRAPDFTLTNQDGETVSMRDLRGRAVIVTFLYTHCEETCPPQAHQIKGALDELGREAPALAIAVDPPNDSEESARDFLSEARMTGRMDFVLGSEAELRPVWDGYAIQPQSEAAEHQARIVLVDGEGRQRVAFPLEQATPERIAHDVRVLEAE